MALLAMTRMTLADSIRQPVTWLATSLSLVCILISCLFGQFNFETQDRIRMLATAGIAVAVLNGLFLAVILTSTAIHDELASRTSLTLFAKPLSRSSFLIGKALGVWLSVLGSSLAVAGAHGAALAWALHTGFEGGSHRHGVEEGLWVPWGRVAAAHGLAALHTAVMTCAATVLALRLPLVANILACFALFVVGHLLAGAEVMGAVAIPALALFNIDDTIQLPKQALTWSYCLTTTAYAATWCAGCVLVGLAMFKRQDIP